MTTYTRTVERTRMPAMVFLLAGLLILSAGVSANEIDGENASR